MKELKENYPEINWQTQWHDYEDIKGNPTSYISLIVPSSQYGEAEQIYQDLKNEGFDFETSVFDQLIEEIVDFRDERDWQKFHNPKDLAISLSLEASELLENFQWKKSEEAEEDKMDNIIDELADVVIYALLMSSELEINLEQAIKEKIRKNRQKYPVEKSFGSSKKYTDL
ncbi:nucleotide pyrophosphohydrolase [Bacillus sp. HNG]|nr:nucleotide pyrophosphohydrolase [Bacillus sp. HNG]